LPHETVRILGLVMLSSRAKFSSNPKSSVISYHIKELIRSNDQ
jgi:hypothetical protein